MPVRRLAAFRIPGWLMVSPASGSFTDLMTGRAFAADSAFTGLRLLEAMHFGPYATLLVPWSISTEPLTPVSATPSRNCLVFRVRVVGLPNERAERALRVGQSRGAATA